MCFYDFYTDKNDLFSAWWALREIGLSRIDPSECQGFIPAKQRILQSLTFRTLGTPCDVYWTLTACRNAFFAANQQKKLKEKCPTFQNKLSSFRVRRASHFRRFPLFLWKKNRENDAIHSNIFNLRNIFDTFSILFRIVWLLAPGFHRWKSRYELQLHRVFSTVEAFSG